MHLGRKGFISAEQSTALLTFYKNHHKDGLVVSVATLTAELIHLDPTLVGFPFDVVKRRIHKYFNVNKIVRCSTTHAVQDCMWDDNMVNDFSTYIHREVANQRCSPNVA